MLADTWPPTAELPAETGRAPGAALRTAAAAVAGAASREHALPIFTGVRVRAAAGSVSLLATDRYRLAAATVPIESTAPFDALVPAGLLARVAPVLGRAETVALHCGGDLFALSWPGGSVTTPTLGDAFPDAQFDRLLDVAPECVAEVESDTLAHAVDRAAAYAGQQGRITLQSIEGALLVRASDPLRGESEETVKATVRSGQATRSYQARLLGDALRAFAGEPVQLRIQPALRATEVTTATADLRYLIVPMRQPDPS
ncbi:DNA polymerase III subunit beta family protein [Dactylosporangium darangshiense]|uniref:DNA polymerase III subunit beta family protein n=1 Tax=Dactylosporangium darangshiense TaxID=579108 RepID=UPI00362FACA9